MYTKSLLTLFTLLIIFSIVPKTYAALSYGSGYYTNICGTGYGASANSCNHGCNTSTGSCSSSGPYVVKWTCDGNATECRNNESTWTTYQSFSGTPCNTTVQIDVFDKNCRASGGWNCTTSNLIDYMVWYSGSCTQATPTPTASNTPSPMPTSTATPTPTTTPTASLTPSPSPTPTPAPAIISSCDSLSTISGNNTSVPANVTVRTRANNATRYRFYFGDGTQTETDNAEIQHQYQNSGSFLTRVDIRDSAGVWKTSSNCETTVLVQSSIIESHKSDCSDLFILNNNYAQAPTTVQFLISAYDNKGNIRRYKMDFGDGTVVESDNAYMNHYYNQSGTYTARGYMLDSESVWKGGSNACQKSVYMSTRPLTTQPSTGTPTGYSLAAIASGMMAVAGMFLHKRLTA